jgi:two-component system, OmpR family, phosphate regulon sensor histidine kinase PhoR
MKLRMHITLITILGSAVLLMLLFIYLFFVSIAVELVEQQGVCDIRQLADEITIMPHPVNYQLVAGRYAAENSIHIIIVDMNLNLLADSNRPESLSGKYFNANLSAAKKGGAVSSIVRDRKNNTMSISVGKMIDTTGSSSGPGQEQIIISCVYSLQSFHRLTSVLGISVVIIFLLLILLVLLLTKYALQRYRKPISNLLQHTKKAAAARGSYNKISIDTANPELLQLVKDFNSLIDKYDLLIASDNAKYSKINSLLSHIRTGIMIVDPENKISLINPRAEELMRVDKAKLFSHREGEEKKSPMLQILFGLTELVNEDKQTRTKTITTEEGVLLDLNIEAMYSKYIPYDHSGSLVLIRDVTEIRRLERLKDEFVSNVSHELRTPLTVINGFVQTLQSWDSLNPEDRMQSLTIIELETERLKRLISELLMLSRIEGEMDGSHAVTFDAVSILADAVNSLRPVAQEKSISLEIVSKDSARCLLRGREIWFKQIAVNLIDNAVKYSLENSAVQIRLSNSGDNQVRMEVSDQGIGIPEDDVQRIFERFYRVEKSRNSRIAGSGLGLSITKLMVEEFHGEITVKSSIGVGTTITVLLPVAEYQEQDI